MRRLFVFALILYGWPMRAQTAAHTISPGMTKAQVIAVLGEPATARTVGEDSYLFYSNACGKRCGMNDLVVLHADSVADAIFRSPDRHYTGKSSSELRNMREAKQRGAEVICVTSGGKLLEAASKDEIKTIKIPPGQLHRSAIGYLFVPLVVTVERLGLADGQIEKLSHAIKLMKNARESLRFENQTSRNVAKQTAEALFGKLTAIYGAPGYRAAVASRWKSQIDANSKALAFTGAFPELALGDISGWEFANNRPGEFGIVILRDPTDKGEIAELMDASEEVLQQFNVLRIDIKGATSMERLFYGVYLGDYVSYYLALLYEVNPSVTENVSLVEAIMAGEPEPDIPAEPE